MAFIKSATEQTSYGQNRPNETAPASKEDKPKATRSDRFPCVEGILQDIEATFSRRQFAFHG